MSSNSYKQTCQKLLNPTGITINGNKPYDMQVHNPKTYQKILAKGSLGLGESYMEGWWDAKELDQFFYRLTKNKPKIKIFNLKLLLQIFKSLIINPQSIRQSKKVAKEHYDLGNDFYKHMLDSRYMQYTCAYWKNAKTLDKAQIDKLNLICKKLNLPKKSGKKTEKVLELRSGFGGFANFAAEHYNCKVLSYNISKEQVDFARKLNKGLPVKIKEQDYRNAKNPENKNSFDKIASIGMCEHVGSKNYKNFMKIADYCLKKDGLFLVHTIGSNKTKQPRKTDPWIKKYMFPGGYLPSATQIIKAAEGYFKIQDLQNLGHDYDKTLIAWFDNFNKNWPKFKDKFGEKFYRMWKYYLLSCAGAFRSGNISLFQFVFSKEKTSETYKGVR